MNVAKRFFGRFDRSIVLSLAMMIIVIALLCCSLFTGTTYADDDDADWSFYKVASAAATFTNDVLGPSRHAEGTIGDWWDDFVAWFSGTDVDWSSTVAGKIGNAGGFMGYSDRDKTPGSTGWLSTAISGSSTSYSKNMFDASSEYGFYHYVRFGSLLSDINFDAVGSSFSAMENLLRAVSGYLMMGAYAFSVSADKIFAAIITFLKWVNPFRLLGGFIDWMNVGITSSDVGGSFTGDGSLLSGIAGYISDIMKTINLMGWTVTLPLMFAMLLFGYFIQAGHRPNGREFSQKLKKYVIRVAFLAIGIPLCGALYTSALNDMGEYVSGNMGASSIIMSTYIDFENWAENTRLGIPSNAYLAVDANGNPTPETLRKLRNTCHAINDFAHGGTGSGIMGNVGGTWEEAIGGTTSDIHGDWNSDEGRFEGSAIDVAAESSAWDLLFRYANSEFYYASDFETAAKGNMDSSQAYKWITQSDMVDDYKTNQATSPLEDESNRLFFGGNLSISSVTDGVRYTGYGANTGPYVSNNGGLSPMSMYNYLSTTFGGSNAVVYSAEKVASAAVRESHYSVNLIGNGFTAILYWLNSFVMLFAFGILGWFYAFSILFTNLKRGINMLTSIPFAMLGGLHAIAKVITYTVMLIVEILATFFMYSMIQSLLIAVSDLFGNIFFLLFSTSALFGGSLGVILPLIAGIILYIMFVRMALKLRKSMVKMIDEWSGNVISKFIVGSPMPMGGSSGPGALRQAAGAAASGAGMAAGHRLMNGAMNHTNGQNATAGDSGSYKDVGTGENHKPTQLGLPGGSTPASGGSPGGAPAGGADGMSAADGASAGGSGGIGMAAHLATDAAFGDSKADARERSLAEHMDALSTGGNSAEDKAKKKQAEELHDQAVAASLTGKTSAMDDERNADAKKALEAQKKKEAAIQQAKGGAEAVVGVGELVGAYFTGDPELAKDGVENVVAGVETANKGKHDMDVAGRDAQAAVEARQLSENKANGGKSPMRDPMEADASADLDAAKREAKAAEAENARTRAAMLASTATGSISNGLSDGSVGDVDSLSGESDMPGLDAPAYDYNPQALDDGQPAGLIDGPADGQTDVEFDDGFGGAYEYAPEADAQEYAPVGDGFDVNDGEFTSGDGSDDEYVDSGDYGYVPEGDMTQYDTVGDGFDADIDGDYMPVESTEGVDAGDYGYVPEADMQQYAPVGDGYMDDAGGQYMDVDGTQYSVDGNGNAYTVDGNGYSQPYTPIDAAQSQPVDAGYGSMNYGQSGGQYTDANGVNYSVDGNGNAYVTDGNGNVQPYSPVQSGGTYAPTASDSVGSGFSYANEYSEPGHAGASDVVVGQAYGSSNPITRRSGKLSDSVMNTPVGEPLNGQGSSVMGGSVANRVANDGSHVSGNGGIGYGNNGSNDGSQGVAANGGRQNDVRPVAERTVDNRQQGVVGGNVGGQVRHGSVNAQNGGVVPVGHGSSGVTRDVSTDGPVSGGRTVGGVRPVAERVAGSALNGSNSQNVVAGQPARHDGGHGGIQGAQAHVSHNIQHSGNRQAPVAQNDIRGNVGAGANGHRPAGIQTVHNGGSGNGVHTNGQSVGNGHSAGHSGSSKNVNRQVPVQSTFVNNQGIVVNESGVPKSSNGMHQGGNRQAPAQQGHPNGMHQGGNRQAPVQQGYGGVTQNGQRQAPVQQGQGYPNGMHQGGTRQAPVQQGQGYPNGIHQGGNRQAPAQQGYGGVSHVVNGGAQIVSNNTARQNVTQQSGRGMAGSPVMNNYGGNQGGTVNNMRVDNARRSDTQVKHGSRNTVNRQNANVNANVGDTYQQNVTRPVQPVSSGGFVGGSQPIRQQDNNVQQVNNARAAGMKAQADAIRMNTQAVRADTAAMQAAMRQQGGPVHVQQNYYQNGVIPAQSNHQQQPSVVMQTPKGQMPVQTQGGYYGNQTGHRDIRQVERIERTEIVRDNQVATNANAVAHGMFRDDLTRQANSAKRDVESRNSKKRKRL